MGGWAFVSCAHPVARAASVKARAVLREVAAWVEGEARGGLVELNRGERAGAR